MNSNVQVRGGPLAQIQYAVLRAGWFAAWRWGVRGLQRTTWALGHWFPHTNATELTLGNGSRLEIPLWDGYWMPLVLGRSYEPEVEGVLEALLRDADAFLDCGANIGYWSAWAIGRVPTIIAVEAAPPIFSRLERTAALNRGAFQPLNRVVWPESGETVEIVTHQLRHAGSSAVNRKARRGTPGYEAHHVLTVSLVDLVELCTPDPGSRVVIKLDLEGIEESVFPTILSRLQNGRTVVIYEDHGSTTNSPITRLGISEGLAVWSLDPRSGPMRVRSEEQAQSIKTARNRGYNFAVALEGSEFHRTLESLAVKR